MANKSSSLEDHGSPTVALVWGAGGIGRALASALSDQATHDHIFLASRSAQNAPKGVRAITADMLDEGSIQRALEDVVQVGCLRTVVVATGVLHGDLEGKVFGPEKSLRSLDAGILAHVMQVNTIGPMMVAKACFEAMPRQGRTVFAALSARVGSISDNRLGGWYSYRASKAALNMMIKTAAIEWSRRNPESVCVGLHPGTVATALSDPFQAGVAKKKLFSPEESAGKLLSTLEGLQAGDTGKLFAYDGQEILP